VDLARVASRSSQQSITPDAEGHGNVAPYHKA
jgi:hypothetical protein